MKFLLKSLKIGAYAFWLGYSLGIIGLDIGDWQFYFVIIPTIILINVFYKLRKD